MQDKLVALIAGPTNKTNLFKYGTLKPENYETFLCDIVKPLVENVRRINIIPDEGVSLDIAKMYKALAGKESIGYVPKGGFKQFESNFRYLDSIEEFDAGWSALNTCLSLRGDLIIAFGMSPGTIVEISYTKYHKKYLEKTIPVFLDSRTISCRLNKEIEDEICINYFNSGKELSELLLKMRIQNA